MGPLAAIGLRADVRYCDAVLDQVDQTRVVHVAEIGGRQVGLDFSAVAEAGGTDHTILADLGRTGVLSEAMQAVREREIASLPCDYPLPDAASAQGALQHINLVHDGMPLTRVDGKSQCDGVKNAWYFDDPSSPHRALVCPSACAGLQHGTTTIQLGCPTVLSKS